MFNLGFAVGDRVLGIVDLFQDDMNAKALVKSIVYLLAWMYFFFYVHGEESREYYKVGKLSIKRVIVADSLGIILGLGSGALLIFG